jgi:uncharacterized protein (DUF952 family)
LSLIYKICPQALWQEAESTDRFVGAAIDVADGYIHFSTAAQVRETVEKHFAGQDDLLVIAVDDQRLGQALRYEPSRGGALFPHLYGALATGLIRWVQPLPMLSDGRHVFPGDIK